MTFDEWFDTIRKINIKRIYFSTFTMINWWNYIKPFRKDKIKILLFEEFKNDQEYFIKKLINFLGLKLTVKILELSMIIKQLPKIHLNY